MHAVPANQTDALAALLAPSRTAKQRAAAIAANCPDGQVASVDWRLAQWPLSASERERLTGAQALFRPLAAPPLGDRLDSPQAVAAHCRDMAALPQERLVALGLDRCYRLLATTVVHGGPAGVRARPQEVLGGVLRPEVVAVVLVHNHPSGSPRPSAADRAFTARMAQACRIVGLRMADHVVVASRGFCSMAALGWLGAAEEAAWLPTP